MFDEKCEIASTNSLKAYYSEGVHVICAKGYKLSQFVEPKIVQLPIEIFPPQFRVEFCGEPGPKKLQPYSESKIVRIGKKVESFVVHTAEGLVSVEVQEVSFFGIDDAGVKEVASFGGGMVVEGISGSFSFDEAFQDALRQIPEQDPVVVDGMMTTKVVSIGSVHGGIAGLNLMKVILEVCWT